jgi:hypothetical protein
MKFVELQTHAGVVHAAQQAAAQARETPEESILFVKRFLRLLNTLGGCARPPPVVGWSGDGGAARQLSRDAASVATLTARVVRGELVATTLAARGWRLVIAHLVAALALCDLAAAAASDVVRHAKKENDAMYAAMKRRFAEGGGAAPKWKDLGGLQDKYSAISTFISELGEDTLTEILYALDYAVATEDKPLRVVKLIQALPTPPGHVSEAARISQEAARRVEDLENF